MGRKAIDISGQRFGNLVAIRRVGTAMDSSGRQALWKCICDCGAFHDVLSQSLRNGTTNRCPACSRTRVPVEAAGRTIQVDLWFFAAGETGGFAIARDQDTGAIITHSHWNRRPLGAQPWQGYGALRFVLKRLVMLGRAKPKPAAQTIDVWCRHNAIILNPARKGQPHFFTTRPVLAKLWAEAEASGTGPEPVELERPDGDRRVAVGSSL